MQQGTLGGREGTLVQHQAHASKRQPIKHEIQLKSMLSNKIGVAGGKGTKKLVEAEVWQTGWPPDRIEKKRLERENFIVDEHGGNSTR